jgi:hypothetical protein
MSTLFDRWPEKGLIGPIGKELNKIARKLNGLRGFDGIEVFDTPTGLHIYGGAGGGADDGGLWAPGEIDPDDPHVIEVFGGILVDTMRAHRVLDATNGVTVTSGTRQSPSYIYLRMPYDGTPSIASESVSQIPVPTKDEYRHPLIEVALERDEVVILRRLCRDVIVINGLMARF